MEKVINVTLITTVKNEENTIHKFLESIFNQQKKPDEIIIVDGGSTDSTIKKIKKYSSIIKNLKVIIKKGNRSVGRNVAIKNSTYDVIACTDAGCILDKKWLKQITEPFKDKSIDVVAGFYLAKTNSIFEKCLSTYTCVMSDRVNLYNFLPSSRSIAFKKSAWKKVSGYPENLDTCEDLVFAKRLRNSNFKFKTIKSAIVYWPQRKNIWEAAKQIYSYSKGDGLAGYIRKSTPFLFGRYIVGLLVLGYILIYKNYILFFVIFLLLLAYFIWAIRKNYKYVRHWKAFFYLPVLQLVSDIAVILGMINGFLEKLRKR